MLPGNATRVRSRAHVVEIRTGPPYLLPARRVLHELLPDVYRALRAGGDEVSGARMESTDGAEARAMHEWRAAALAAYGRRRKWHTQAALYLMRLNDDMQSRARKALRKCSGAGRMVGVPVRASDKCKGNGGGGEMKCVKAMAIRDVVARVRVAQPWIDVALVTSEDKEAAQKVGDALRGDGWIVRENYGDVQQGSGVAGVRSEDGKPFEGSMWAILSLVCQIRADVHVLTFRSNFHSLIDMLAKVVPGKRYHFSYSVGDLWYPV